MARTLRRLTRPFFPGADGARAEKRGFEIDSDDEEEDGGAFAAHQSKMTNALH